MKSTDNKKLQSLTLGLLLSRGMSLKIWDECGILTREIAPYNILAKHFKKIYVFTYGDAEELEYKSLLAQNIEIRCNDKKVGRIWYPFLLPVKHRKEVKECDILKTEQMQGIWAAIIARIVNRKVRLVVRTGYSLSFMARRAGDWIGYARSVVIEWWAYHLCDTGLVTSREIRENIISRYGVSAKKIHLIANYIDTELFRPDDSVIKYDKRILYVGRLSKQKNIANLLDAIKGTGIFLDIIGQGKLEKELKEKVKQEKIEVRFMGVVSNEKLPEIFNKYRMAVLPSLYEGMPKTLLEAMSCGLACVATNVAGSKEVINHNENGLLADTSAESLRASILKLASDEELQRRLSVEARAFVVEKFSLQGQIKKEVKIYEHLV